MSALSVLAPCVTALGMSWSLLPIGLLWCTFAGVSLYCLFMMLQLLVTNQRGASVMTLMMLSPMMMIGGGWWPIEVTPAWMQSVASFLPTGWAMNALINFGRGPSAALPAVGLLLVSSLAMAWASARSFRYQWSCWRNAPPGDPFGLE